MGANPQGWTMRHWTNRGQPSESDNDGQESVADGCAERGTSGDDPSTSADDQDAGASRAVDSVHQLGQRVYKSKVGHWGLDICRRRLSEEHPRRGERGVTDRMIKEFIRQSSDESYETADQDSSIHLCFL